MAESTGVRHRISALTELISTTPPPFIFAHAPLGALPPVSSQLASALESQPSICTIRINAVECFSAKILFTTVVNALAGWNPSWALTFGTGGECWEGPSGGKWDANWDTFLEAITAAYKQRTRVEKSETSGALISGSNDELQVVLLFDRAERLRLSLPTLVVPIVRIGELSSLPITTVFISSSAWEDVSPPGTTCPDPYVFQLPTTSNADFVSSLLVEFPPASHQLLSDDAISPFNPTLKSLYAQYLDVIFKSCSNYTNDPADMAYIASAMWPGFVRPLLEDWTADAELVCAEGVESVAPSPFALPSEDSREILITRFLRTFHTAFNSLYSRSISARSFIQMQKSQPSFRLSQPMVQVPGLEAHKKKITTATGGLEVILPAPTKMLLVAAYIASFNPVRTDLRMFGRTPDGLARKRKRAGPRKARPGTVAKIPQRLAGPSPFSMERLMAIYASLVVEHGDGTDHFEPLGPGEVEVEINRSQVLMNISELTQLRLLHRITQGEKLDSSIVMKCNITAEAAERFAKDLKFNLGEMLWDPPE